MADKKIFNLFPEPIASYTLGREFTKSEKTTLLNQDWKRPPGKPGGSAGNPEIRRRQWPDA